MNKEIKQLWIENLRNGKYAEMKQEYFPKGTSGDFTLRWKNYYNPFGVLCDLYAKAFGIEKPWESRFSKNYPDWKSVEFLRQEWEPPASVYIWAWMKRDPIQEKHMWNMSFEEAAKYIEDNL
jgi:hypothetical protein